MGRRRDPDPFEDEQPQADFIPLINNHRSPHPSRVRAINARKGNLAFKAGSEFQSSIDAALKAGNYSNSSGLVAQEFEDRNLPVDQRDPIPSSRKLYNAIMIQPDVNTPAGISYPKKKKKK